MSQMVIQLDKKTLSEINTYYSSSIVKSAPYSVFTAKTNDTTITAYKSGKVLFQGRNAEKEANRWKEMDQTLTKKRTSNPSASAASSELPAHFSEWSVVGSDEVGNGSYFGSLPVCAVYAPKEQLSLLKSLGVRDSKNLNDQQIIQIAKQLEVQVEYVLTIITPQKYNEIQPTMSQGKMKAILHNHTLSKLLKKISPIRPEAILIDQFELPSTYKKHIADEKEQILEKVYFKTKAESSHLAVAAASIIARYHFLKSLDELSKEVGMRLPSGAGIQSDHVAAKVYERYGMEGLEKTAKVHFANTQKAIALSKE